MDQSSIRAGSRVMPSERCDDVMNYERSHYGSSLEIYLAGLTVRRGVSFSINMCLTPVVQYSRIVPNEVGPGVEFIHIMNS